MTYDATTQAEELKAALRELEEEADQFREEFNIRDDSVALAALEHMHQQAEALRIVGKGTISDEDRAEFQRAGYRLGNAIREMREGLAAARDQLGKQLGRPDDTQ